PSGELLGAPHFAHDPCLNLNNYKLREWNGLLFEDNGRDIAADLAGMGTQRELSFEGYALDHVELHECNYNWKTFIEVYLEDYHVGPFHPGLGNFVTCDDLKWEFQKEYSVQTVGVASTFGKPGSDVYKKWHEVLLKYREGKMPERGAIWLTYYPHIMVEWYPHVLTVSTLHPIGVDKTLNMVEFYYPEEIVAFEREFVEAQRAAYMETCIEDDEIAERMDAGRKALMERGDNEVGPYQSPMEDGMQHFHEWYRGRMGAAVSRG
ncbi:SRPBCC family protein, partial [Diaphorobacter sp.]|uniref:aromatic ring-hydroxylating oxygenase subunit alpha n=1 Tax=Diaphorobacter sp. TaxID=1934310 RepID=UPI0025871593